MQTLTARCCIAGGGPAGIMLGYLLARAGIEVIVLEKWPDFFRDFRGDTIHPSTMDVLHELGLLDDFLKLPHEKTRRMTLKIGEEDITVADFAHIQIRNPYIAFIPQWDFLNFMTAHAKKFPHFKLLMHTEAIQLIDENGRVQGMVAQGPDGPVEIRAELTVGADGRHSIVREKSKLPLVETGAPIDVLWFKLPVSGADPEQSFGYINDGIGLVTLDRGDYWQCGLIIQKGDFEHIKKDGIEKFRMMIARLAPHFSSVLREIDDWDKIKLLSVTIDHLTQWYKPGLLVLGDAAHAMSPMGGVGINLAIQDAVAAGNVLIPAFRKGVPSESDCADVQKRRWFPTRMTQRLQVFMQDKFLQPYMRTHKHLVQAPWQLRALNSMPILRSIPARIVGIGFRPEHIRKDLFS
jgi:2-polyprenyl-6-methoxyphenol hydroxylase-like FAD-dependent oxidoreductase